MSHPESVIRHQAVKRLNVELSKPDCVDETKMFAVNSLSNILAVDTHPEVITEACRVSRLIDKILNFFSLS